MTIQKIICGFGMASGSLLGIGFLFKLNHWLYSTTILTAGLCSLVVFINLLGIYIYTASKRNIKK